jgi:hypothetical protein
MTRKRRPPDHTGGKDEASDAGERAMRRFRALTRELLNVSNKQLREEQERYGSDKRDRRKRAKE